MKKFGFIPSTITKDTVKFDTKPSKPIPNKYSLKLFLSPVTNQGENPYCIPHSIATWLNWKANIKTGTKVDFHVKYEDIFRSKKGFGDGMTYIEAFDYLKTKGVRTDKGIMKITEAGIIPSHAMIKPAIIANGPIFGALPVYDVNSNKFWQKTSGNPIGYHSITIVGWDENGYIIRNSWGTSFGNGGYVTLPYQDVIYFIELWTILG